MKTIVVPERTPWPELEEASATHRRLEAELREAYKDEQAAHATKRAAVDADRRALAEAYKAEGKEPDAKAVERAERDLSAVIRRREALELAVREQEEEIRQLVAERSAEWLADLERRQEEKRDGTRELFEQLAAELDQIGQLTRLAGFVRNPDARKLGAAWDPPVPELVARNGDAYTLGQVVAALRTTFDPPARETPPAPAIGGSLKVLLQGSEAA
jgi:hypothetical protein